MTIDDVCRLKSKACWQQTMKTFLLISDPVASQKIQAFKLGKTCGFDDIPSEYPRHLPRRPLAYLTHVFNYCLLLRHFPAYWNEANAITAKIRRRPKLSPNLTSHQPLVSYGKLLQNLILGTIQKHAEERNLLNASQFDFQADHNTTLQCMRLEDHVNLNFNNMSTAAVFLDIEKSFDTTEHSAYYISCQN
jgi:hypothetical protein